MNLFIPDHPQIITKRAVLHAKEKVKKRQKGNNNNKTNPNRCEGVYLWSALGSLRRDYQEMEDSFSFTAKLRQAGTKPWKRYFSLSFPQYSHFLLIAWNNFTVQSLLPPATFNILFKCLIAQERHIMSTEVCGTHLTSPYSLKWQWATLIYFCFRDSYT